MNNLKEYILEKFKISKDIDTTESNPDDPTTWKKGDILVGSSGYSMILVDFYKIIKATGKSFVVRELKKKNISGNGWQGECIPIENEFDPHEKEQMVRINKHNSVKVGGKYGAYLYLWNGKPQHYDHMD